jgi:hypothetical protein
MSKKLIIFAVLLGIVILIGYYVYTNYYLPSTVTLPPPLENVDFPSEPVPYPADWLDELKFPNEFTLVDSSSGTLPEATTQGWAAKFRYQGKPSEATKSISSFMKEKGWTVAENKLDSGGNLLLIQREQGSGIIVIDFDPNDASKSLVVATIFP